MPVTSAATTDAVLLCGRCALQPSPTEFHRPKCGNGEDITGHVRSPDASVSCRRKRRLEKVARFLDVAGVCAAGIELFDRLDRGEPLPSRVA